MESDVVAVMDVATVYGAVRWLYQAHQKPEWPHISAYHPSDDHQSFNDLLHYLVLYDKIVIFHSRGCADVSFAQDVNRLCGFELMDDRDSEILGAQYAVMNAIAHLLARSNGQQKLRQFVPNVPFLYSSGQHVDMPEMIDAAERNDLSPILVPLALFLYRGVCYAGLANGMAKRDGLAVAYVASPGRLSAMRLVMSSKDVETAEYPRSAYRDLVAQLDLPSNGYDFGFLDSFPASSLSGLALALQSETPQAALNSVLSWRDSTQSRQLRADWASRVFDYRTSAAV